MLKSPATRAFIVTEEGCVVQEDKPAINRDMLVGLLAIQLRMASAEQLVDALKVWVGGTGEPFVDTLSRVASLSECDRQLLCSVVDTTIARHGGDATMSLASFDGQRELSRILARAGAGTNAEQITETLGLPRDFVETELEELAAVEEAPGRYSRTNEYSRGGMGRIMLVHDEYIGRDIALKELLPAGAGRDTMLGELSPTGGTSSVLRRFLHEARLTGQLEHPAIVPVYELGRNPAGGYYYTMKLVRGKTLAQALKGGATLEQRLRFLSHFVDLCQAIAYAHSRGVIHRDIKPANVMVGSFGETVVIDWGLAKVKGKADLHKEDLRSRSASDGVDETDSKGSTATARGIPVGTPVYMSPEQAEGRIDDVDERSDVYSLGAVLYVLLTGMSPFTGGSARDVMRRVIHDDPLPVCSVDSRVPPELAGICHKALQKDPDARYQSAQELAEEIERYQSGALVHAYDYGLGEMLWRFYNAHRAVLHTAAAFLLILLCVGVYSYISVFRARNREREQRFAAEQAQQAAVAAREQENVARTVAEHAAYVAEIRLAGELLENDDHEHADSVLWKTNERLRNYEWGFLLNRSNPEFLKLPNCRWGACSPDGSTAMMLQMNGTVQTWDLAARSVLAAFPARTDQTPAYSPDGGRIVTTIGREAIVRDVRTGAELLRVSGHEGEVQVGAFSPDGARIITASDDGTARIWDGGTGDCTCVLSGHAGAVLAALFSPDGAQAVTVAAEGFRVWDTNTGERLFSLEGHRPEYDRDGRRIAAFLDKEVHVWDAASGSCVLRWSAGQQEIRAVHFSPDGQSIVTAAPDGMVTLWDSRTGAKNRTFEHEETLTDAVYDPSGERVVTAAADGRIRVWGAKTGEELMNVRVNHADITSMSFSKDGTRMLTVGRDDKARLWSLRAFPDRSVCMAYSDTITAIAFSNNGRWCAIVTADGQARIRDTGAEQERLSLCVSPAMGMSLQKGACVAFDPASERVAIALDPFSVTVCDVPSGALVSLMTGHKGEITSLAYSPDGTRLVSGSWDDTARIWNTRTGESERILRGHRDSVLGVAWSGDGKQIVTTSADGSVKVWDAQQGAELRTMTGHTAAVSTAVFSPDGLWIATASEDNTARIWDAESGLERVCLAGHTRSVVGVAFSPDGSRVVTASADGVARLWESPSGDGLIALPRTGAGLTAAAFSRDGASILLGSRAGSVRVLEAAPWRPEQLPGDAATPERYRLYREACLDAADEPPPSTSAPRMTVVTTVELLGERMRRLRDALLKEADAEHWFAEGALEVRAGACAQAVARVCLKPGDRIVRIGEWETASREGMVEALDAALKLLDEMDRGRLEMEIIREGERMGVQFEAVKCRVEQRRLALSRDDALSMIRREREMMEAGTEVMLKVGQRNAAAIGEPAQGGQTLRGMWVPETGDPLKKALCLAVETVPGERVLEMNGHPITSLDVVFAEYDHLLRALEAGEPCSLRIHSERGEFQRVERQIAVE